MGWIKIRAKFIGSTSLGFRHNEIYCLNVDPGGHINRRIRIIDTFNNGHACEYTRLEMFTKNWVVTEYQTGYMVGWSKQEPFLTLESEFTKIIRDYKLTKLIDAKN
jgi:hypothetical protein